MNKEIEKTKSQLRVLGVFYYLFAAFGIIGLLMIPQFTELINTIIEMFLSTDQMQHLGEKEKEFIHQTIRLLVGMVILLNIVHIIVYGLTGFGLMKGKFYWPCFVAGVLTILAFPIGTPLGIFTVIVLNKPEAKQIFGIKEKLSSSKKELE